LLGLTAALLLGPAAPTFAGGEKPAPKKLLVITESKGFRHGCVTRGKDGELCLVEKTLIELGKKSGAFEAICTQNSREAITAENLKNFDAVFFYTTGELPLSDTQKADLLAFIRSGKGFSGSHSATDTFYRWKEYGELIGGYFDGHPWHTKIKVIVEDQNHPATKHLGSEFTITDEIYQFRAPYTRSKLHVLMKLDPTWANERRKEELVNIEKAKQALPERLAKLEAEGKKEEAKKLKAQVEGRRPGIHRMDDDHALAWTHEYGKGRVFYTALGHRDEVWRDERFQQHMLGGLRYVLRLADADATPSGELKGQREAK
jgi:type 1 glutamine amidotransferase